MKSILSLISLVFLPVVYGQVPDLTQIGRDPAPTVIEDVVPDVVPDLNSRWFLHYAIKSGDVEGVRRALYEEEGIANRQDARGARPLALAVEKGHIKIIKLLLNMGADPDDLCRPVSMSLTCLQHVAREGKTEIARRLLQGGVDPDLQDENTYTLSFSGLFFGADPNLQDEDGNTALHFAARAGHLEMAQALLEFGADPNIKDAGGLTAFHYAVWQGLTPIAQALLDSGAYINMTTARGMTALHAFVLIWTADLSSFNYSPIMLKVGFPPDIVVSLKFSTLQWLLDQGANPNIRDAKGRTPLHHTAYVGDTEMSNYLLEAGADPSIKDGFLGLVGKTPLDYALQFKRMETAEAIQAYIEDNS